MRKVVTSFIIAALAAASGSAQASLIKVSFEGQNSSATAPDNNSLGDGLSTISGYVIYDTETPGTVFVSNSSRNAHNYAGAIKEFAFRTGAVTGSRAGDFGSMQVSDQFTTGQDRLSFNSIYLSPSQIAGEFPDINQVQFTIGLLGPFSALSNAALPGVFDPSIFNAQANISLFVQLLDPASQPGVIKSLNFNFTSVTVEELSEVPLPGALGLFFLGGGALLVSRRKKARV